MMIFLKPALLLDSVQNCTNKFTRAASFFTAYRETVNLAVGRSLYYLVKKPMRAQRAAVSQMMGLR